MSTSMRRTRAQALDLADQFANLLAPAVTCDRFEFAGSLRRQRPDVGDIDIVAIPKWGEMPGDDMLQTPTVVNLLWHRIDDLIKAGTFTKHIKDTLAGPRTKWGEGCRAIEFRGCAFEIQLADVDNWGGWMAVRTGPAELSKDLVTRIPKYGHTLRDGFYVFEMAFSMTTQQVRDGSKLVTRRDGWHHLRAGDRLMAIEKGMGLKKGEKVVYLRPLEVVSAIGERLEEIESNPVRGPRSEVDLEGFPGMTPAEFVTMFLKANKRCVRCTTIIRIEFKYL